MYSFSNRCKGIFDKASFLACSDRHIIGVEIDSALYLTEESDVRFVFPICRFFEWNSQVSLPDVS